MTVIFFPENFDYSTIKFGYITFCNIIYNINNTLDNRDVFRIKIRMGRKQRKINIKKHGISFEVAMSVFTDPYRLDQFDVEHSIDEDRFNVIGNVTEQGIILLTVTYTLREEQRVYRIISARRATKKEEKKYYDSYKNIRYI